VETIAHGALQVVIVTKDGAGTQIYITILVFATMRQEFLVYGATVLAKEDIVIVLMEIKLVV